MRTIILFTVIFTSIAVSGRAGDAEPNAREHKAPAASEGDTLPESATSTASTIAEDDTRRPALKSLIVLKVANPNEAKAAIKKRAEEKTGYMSYVDDHGIVVKLPPKALSEMMAFTAEQGVVLEKTLERQDLTLAIAELDGQLASKQEILGRMRGFFDDSDATATLDIEQSMNRLVLEIERVKGQLRVLNDRADWAVLNISFRFRERDRVVYVSSPFEWLNTASLDRFLEEF